MSLQMTPEEIKRSYKQAADKRKQISILADLNLCDTGFIITILKENGIPADELPRRRTKAEIEADNARRRKKRENKMTTQDNRQHEKEQAERQEEKAVTAYMSGTEGMCISPKDIRSINPTIRRPFKQETDDKIPEVVFEAVEREIGVCVETIKALTKRADELKRFLEDHKRAQA